MKTLNITFDDEEYKKLQEAKGDKTWKEFFLTLIELKGGKEQ